MMSVSAIITMVLTMGVVTGFTGYFFYKVLTIPKKNEPDSYAENDEDEHLSK